MKGEANMSENYNDKNIKKILESENVPQELKPESIKIMLDKFSGERKNKINFKRTGYSDCSSICCYCKRCIWLYVEI